MALAKEEARAALGKGSVKDVSEAEALAIQKTLWNSRFDSHPAAHPGRSTALHNLAEARAWAALASPGQGAFRALDPRAPSPTPTVYTLGSESDTESLASGYSTRATSVESLPDLNASDTNRKLAALYINEVLRKPGKFTTGLVGYVASSVLDSTVRIWSPADVSGTVRWREHYESQEQTTRPIDVVFNGRDHFDAFGPDAPAASTPTVAARQSQTKTIADGNCFFHALAQQSNYGNYNTAESADARLHIANTLRAACADKAEELFSNGDSRAIDALAHSGAFEVEHHIEQLDQLTATPVAPEAAAELHERITRVHEQLGPWAAAGVLTATQRSQLARLYA